MPCCRPRPLPSAHKMMNMKIWKRVSTAMPSLAFAFSIKSTAPPEKGVVTGFLLNRCGLSQEDIAKVFRDDNAVLRRKSSQSMEEVVKLLNGCGLTNPAQIRRVVLTHPGLLLSSAKRNIQPKLTLLGTFMKEEGICKLLLTNARVFRTSEDKMKSAISLLQRLGFEGQVLRELVARQPKFVATSEEKVLESFKQVESLGIQNGSKSFAAAMRAMLGLGKEHIDRRLRCLSSLGFSEKQSKEMTRKFPVILAISEENLKRHADFLVQSAGLTLVDLLKYPAVLTYSLEKRIIPRYRVMEALKTMKVLKIEMICPNFFKITEKHFLEKYVNKNAESLVLRDVYHWVKDGKLSMDKETCTGSDVGPRLKAVDNFMKSGKLSMDKGAIRSRESHS